MPTISEVRDSIASAITAGCGLRAVPLLTDSLNPPVAVVVASEYDPRLVLGKAKAEYPFTVRVYVNRPAERSAQLTLDGYREPSGTGSVVAAIEDLDNWTETVDYASVTRVGAPTEALIADDLVMAVDFDIEVVW